MADTLEDSSTACDAGLVRVHGTRKALAVTSDVTPRYVAADPYEGGRQAVAEAWRNLTAAGADPLAITDNLNFGNPERPEVMAQFVGAVEGMAEACRALDFPVVSGNVSLYNETNGQAIPPTPTVGGLGLLPDYALRASFDGLEDRDLLVLIGESRGELGASLYLRELLSREDGPPPSVDLQAERRNGDFVRALIRTGEVTVCHDLSDGGLAAAAAEMALASGIGVTLNATSGQHAHLYLFGEDQARYLVATKDADSLIARAKGVGVHAILAGAAGGDAFASRELFTIPLAELRTAHEAWMPTFMGQQA